MTLRPLVNQPNRRPTRKLSSAAVGGGAAATIIWLGELIGLEIPAPVAAYLATVVGAVVGYFVRNRTIRH